MKYLIAACMIFFHINCNVSSRPPYERFNGIEFLPCGDFYNGRIYIKDIHKFNINEIVEFAYCYTSQNNFEGLVIESEYYSGPSFWSGKKRGYTLYKLQFGMVENLESDTEFYLQKEVILALQKVQNEFVEIPTVEYRLRIAEKITVVFG